MSAFGCCSRRPKSTPRVCSPGRHRRQRTRGSRQAAEADPGRTAPPHQEHAGDGQRHCLPEPAQRGRRRACAARHRRPAAGAGARARPAAAGALDQRRPRQIVRGATEAFDDPDAPKFSIPGPDIRIASGAVIAIAMTLNELCTNTTKFGALSIPAVASTLRGPSMNPRSGCTSPGPKRTDPRYSRRPAEFRHPPDRDPRQAAQG